MADELQRRLVAILVADVAGYSRLIGIDNEGTPAQLNAHHTELIEPKLKEHRGRIVRTTSDGLLVLFASAVDALRCAVEIQRVMAQRNAEIPADRRIEFRMGVNVGISFMVQASTAMASRACARQDCRSDPTIVCRCPPTSR